MKRPDDGGVRRVVVATGIASVAAQLVGVREYLAPFQVLLVVHLPLLAALFWLESACYPPKCSRGRPGRRGPGNGGYG